MSMRAGSKRKLKAEVAELITLAEAVNADVPTDAVRKSWPGANTAGIAAARRRSKRGPGGLEQAEHERRWRPRGEGQDGRSRAPPPRR
jgi:hypothetical protein